MARTTRPEDGDDVLRVLAATYVKIEGLLRGWLRRRAAKRRLVRLLDELRPTDQIADEITTGEARR
jgi:hypothetical protein